MNDKNILQENYSDWETEWIAKKKRRESYFERSCLDRFNTFAKNCELTRQIKQIKVGGGREGERYTYGQA